ncbi:MAG: hypothetical protein LBR06_09890 [Bacteroidales bacterium]|jgi:hypothetical protein|nr:hypothetical protein [Bacteroidales bacterium]
MKKLWICIAAFFAAGAVSLAVIYIRNLNKVQIEFNIHINRQAIYLSTYSEPPQFAIWLENPASHKLKQVFVTNRAGVGDWEGKADVPVAVPHWSAVFRHNVAGDDDDELVVSGATPRDEYFRINAAVRPNSEWTVWIEMNLAGDYNEWYPQFNRETHEEDEFACGQPALLYRADIKAVKGAEYTPHLEAMSLWENGNTRLAPVDSTITSAHTVFDRMTLRIIRPKFRFINLKRAEKQEVLADSIMKRR